MYVNTNNMCMHFGTDFNFLQDCIRVSDVKRLHRPKMSGLISKRYENAHVAHQWSFGSTKQTTCR